MTERRVSGYIWPLPLPSQWKFGSIFSAITTAINHFIVVHFVIFHPHSTAFLLAPILRQTMFQTQKRHQAQFNFLLAHKWKTKVTPQKMKITSHLSETFEFEIWIHAAAAVTSCYFVLLLVRQSFLAYFECLPLSNWLFQSGEKSIYYSITFHLWTAKNKKKLPAFKSEFNFVEWTGWLDGWMAISTPLFFIHSKCSNSIVPFSCVFCCCDR